MSEPCRPCVGGLTIYPATTGLTQPCKLVDIVVYQFHRGAGLLD